MSCATECKLHALVLGDFQEELENNLRVSVTTSTATKNCSPEWRASLIRAWRALCQRRACRVQTMLDSTRQGQRRTTVAKRISPLVNAPGPHHAHHAHHAPSPRMLAVQNMHFLLQRNTFRLHQKAKRPALPGAGHFIPPPKLTTETKETNRPQKEQPVQNGLHHIC